MEDHHYFENPAPEEKVLRYDAIVPNVWDYTMSEYASVLASHHNRVGGFAKESKRQLVEERIWKDKMYLYPIPQNESFKNKNLGQNPGWIE